MYIFLARNAETSIDYEHWKDIQGAFHNCEKEYELNNDKNTPFSFAWVENDNGNFEMWIIEFDGANDQSHTAKLTPFEVLNIEVFES